MHDAFLEISRDIRQAAASLGRSDEARVPKPPAGAAPAPDIRTGNLRIRKSFTDRERDGFVDDAYSYITKFFENSLAELASRNPGVEHRFKMIGDSAFTATLYVAGEKRSACRVWLPGRDAFGGDIAYSASDALTGGGMNESLHAESDGYKLGLKPMGLLVMGNRSNELLTPHGAAEYLWADFISRLQ
jgi:hypothetical protein